MILPVNLHVLRVYPSGQKILTFHHHILTSRVKVVSQVMKQWLISLISLNGCFVSVLTQSVSHDGLHSCSSVNRTSSFIDYVEVLYVRILTNFSLLKALEDLTSKNNDIYLRKENLKKGYFRRSNIIIPEVMNLFKVKYVYLYLWTFNILIEAILIKSLVVKNQFLSSWKWRGRLWNRFDGVLCP